VLNLERYTANEGEEMKVNITLREERIPVYMNFRDMAPFSLIDHYHNSDLSYSLCIQCSKACFTAISTRLQTVIRQRQSSEVTTEKTSNLWN
jgi:hypothetical protein